MDGRHGACDGEPPTLGRRFHDIPGPVHSSGPGPFAFPSPARTRGGCHAVPSRYPRHSRRPGGRSRHQRARRADLRHHQLRVQQHRARRQPLRPPGVREHLHPDHEPDQRRLREAGRRARGRHRGAGGGERAGGGDAHRPQPRPGRRQPRLLPDALRRHLQPVRVHPAQVGHHDQVRRHPQPRVGARRHRRRHPAPLRRDDRQSAARRARTSRRWPTSPTPPAFRWWWTTPSAPPRWPARSSTARTSSCIRPPSGSAAMARRSAASWSMPASSTGTARRRGSASPSSARPIPSYHGLVYTEAFGNLRLHPQAPGPAAARPRAGALALQRVPVPAGPRDAAAAHPAPLGERARRRPLAAEGQAGRVGVVPRPRVASRAPERQEVPRRAASAASSPSA